jgi:hypothetical protein
VITTAVQRALAVYGEVHDLDLERLPRLRVTRRGRDVTVHVGGVAIRGRLSGHALLAGRVWGALLGPPEVQPLSLWLPGTDPQDHDGTARAEPGVIWQRENLLADVMQSAALAFLKAGQRQEARLCLRRSRRGSPAEPSDTEPLMPAAEVAADPAGAMRKAMAVRDARASRVPAKLGEDAERLTLAEEATSRKARWGLEGAVRAAVLPFAKHKDPVERAGAAAALGSICEQISGSDPARLHRLAGPALLALLADDEPWVREPALHAALTLAHRLRRYRLHALALPFVEAGLAEGVARREMLAWRFEARLAASDADGAAADWAVVEAMADLPPHRAIEVEPGHYDRTPAWSEFRAAAVARAHEPPRQRPRGRRR